MTTTTITDEVEIDRALRMSESSLIERYASRDEMGISIFGTRY